jgi:hypothetical protein
MHGRASRKDCVAVQIWITIMYQPPLSSEISPSLYNPYTAHLPQYNASVVNSALSYYPQFSQTTQPRSSPAPDIPPPPPDLTSITPQVASRAMHRLIISELRDVGFDSAQLSAVKRIELEVVACTFELPSFYRADPTRSTSSHRTALRTSTRVCKPV